MRIEQSVVKGGLEAIILAIVNEQPTHGYAIILEVKKRHHVYLGPSTVYPLLNTLVKRKLLTSEWSLGGMRPRKIYTITRAGLYELQTLSLQISVLSKEVSKTLSIAVQ